MSKKGYILLDRQIEDNWIWDDKPFSKGQAWIDLLMLVNHSDEKTLFDNELIEVKRGEKITSLVKLSKRWGWSVNKVSRFLNLLENELMITQKRNSKRTALTVVNYGFFQDTQKGNGKVTENRRKADGKLTETNNTLNTLNTLEKKEPACAQTEEDGVALLFRNRFI